MMEVVFVGVNLFFYWDYFLYKVKGIWIEYVIGRKILVGFIVFERVVYLEILRCRVFLY